MGSGKKQISVTFLSLIEQFFGCPNCHFPVFFTMFLATYSDYAAGRKFWFATPRRQPENLVCDAPPSAGKFELRRRAVSRKLWSAMSAGGR